MKVKDKRYHAFALVGMMKKAKNKKGIDCFSINDFNLMDINLYDTAISTISVRSMQDILNYLDVISKLLQDKNKVIPSYNDMRRELKPDQWYL